MKIKKPFQNYFGGKSGEGVYQNIINHIPPHRTFITLFAGNCGILANIKPAEFTIVNDLDLDVVKAWDATGLGVRGDYLITNVDALNFMRCDIMELPQCRQPKHCFIYLDPPYLFTSRRSQQAIYKHEFGDQYEHHQLLQEAEVLSKKGFNIMISHYPCIFYDNHLDTWNTHEFKAKTRKDLVTEKIWYNYNLDGHLHDYRYIGMNFRQREAFKRQKVNMIAKLEQMEPTLRYALLNEIEQTFNKKP